MSVLFPKVNKPREWDFRPRYYDPEKEKLQKLRERHANAVAQYKAQRQADEAGTDGTASGSAESADDARYVTSLHRGSFRESREHAEHVRGLANRRSKLVFWMALLAIVALVLWLLQ